MVGRLAPKQLGIPAPAITPTRRRELVDEARQVWETELKEQFVQLMGSFTGSDVRRVVGELMVSKDWFQLDWDSQEAILRDAIPWEEFKKG